MNDVRKTSHRFFRLPSITLRPRSPLLGYGFILPALLMLALVLGLPVAAAILNSFTPLWEGEGGFTLDNYVSLSKDDLFWNSLVVTLYFVGGTVLLHLIIGLCVALALTTEIRGRQFFRVMAILPWTMPDVISGLIWRFMYNPTSGIINHGLRQLNITNEYIEWLGKPDLALPSVIFADVWRGYPFVMLILLAGLQAIPRELYEAAQVDGASIFAEFRYITLPGIRRIIAIALALDTIWQFRRFGLVYNMTFGGPGHSTEILPMYVYKQYFRYFNFEYASAVAVVSAIIMLIASIPYIYMITRRAE
jgi:multiple sugar transport system permease protein